MGLNFHCAPELNPRPLPPHLTFLAIPVAAPDPDDFSGCPGPGGALGPACHATAFLTFLSFGVYATSRGDLQSWRSGCGADAVSAQPLLSSPDMLEVVALLLKKAGDSLEFPALLPKAPLLLTEKRNHFH